MWLLDEVKPAVDAGRDVIFHCHAGVHRAALTTVLVLMFGLGIPLREAVRRLESARHICWDEAVSGHRRKDGSRRENHMKYLPVWEKQALTLPHRVDIRFLPPLPQVIMPAPGTAGAPEVIDLTAADAESEDAELPAGELDHPIEALAEQSSSSARVSRPTEVAGDQARPVFFVAVTGP